ncbi:MAG: hypothetical protein J7M26_00600 [Armatimonadetes bacterium]|nr:hypothetical protein [Armatimonadota bacterium]
MSWLDRARKALEDVAQSASVEAEVLRLQTRLGSLESERERQFAEAGKRARELQRQRRVLDDELNVILKRIDEIEAEMEQLRAKVQQLRGSQGTPATEEEKKEEGDSSGDTSQ